MLLQLQSLLAQARLGRDILPCMPCTSALPHPVGKIIKPNQGRGLHRRQTGLHIPVLRRVVKHQRTHVELIIGFGRVYALCNLIGVG